MEPAETRGIRGMDSNKQYKIQEFRVCEAEKIQGEKPSLSRMEKYVILRHYMIWTTSNGFMREK